MATLKTGPGVKKGKAPAKNKGGKNKKFFGGHHGYKGVNKKTVNKLVQGIVQQELRDLRNEKKDIRRESQAGYDKSARDYYSAKGDLDHIYGQASQYQNFLNEKTQAAYDEQSATQQAAQAALEQRMANTYGTAQDDINSELARLGIQRGGTTAGLMRDAAFMQSQGALQGDAAASTMDIGAANAQQLGDLTAGMIQGGLAANIGQQLRARSERNAEIGTARRDAIAKLNQAMTSVKRSRPELYFELLNQLQQTGWSQFLQGQQLNMQRKQMNKK